MKNIYKIFTAFIFLVSVGATNAQQKFIGESKVPLPEMVTVEGGKFTMGCTDPNNDCLANELPTHTVTLGSYKIGKYEVTQAQWAAVMGSNPSDFPNCDNCPVEKVSGDDVQTFIQKLNTLTGQTYRLPTEAEWEYAARGGNKSKGYEFSGSNDINSVAWYKGNSDSKPHPVGTKQPNELGIYDMTGNVMEYCSDWLDKNYYKNSPEHNPKGPDTGILRVMRGGAWNLDDYSCYPYGRFTGNNSVALNSDGFRLAQD